MSIDIAAEFARICGCASCKRIDEASRRRTVFAPSARPARDDGAGYLDGLWDGFLAGLGHSIERGRPQ